MATWRILTLICASAILVEAKIHHKRDTTIDICDEIFVNEVQCFCYKFNSTVHAVAADCYLTKENVKPEDEIWDIFTQLKTTKQIIFTNKNNTVLKFVPSRALNHTKALMKLVIKYGLIETIPSFAFANLKNIEDIALRYNQIKNLAKDAFANHEKLKLLSLDNNKLLEINRDVFVNLPALEKLFLINNEINTIHDRALIHLKNLKNLEICKNNLFSLNAETFAGLNNLQRLDLHSNSLEVIGDNTFLPLPKLKYLNLDKNKIQMLDDRAFNGLTNLETLNLANNRLTVLASNKIFQGLTSLMSLNLQKNQIQEFKFEVIQPIWQHFLDPLSSFEIDDNNFPCTCQLDWFLDLMNKTRNNTTKLALENLKCEPSENLRQAYDNMVEKQKSEDSQNPETNDEDYYDETQLGGKLFYSDLRDLLNCSGTLSKAASEVNYFQTTAASFNPSITEYTAMTSTFNPVSTTSFPQDKITNQEATEQSLETSVKTTDTDVFYNEIKKENSTNSYTTNRLATVSAKPKRNFEDVAEISRRKYTLEDMASDEAKPESTKGHKRDYPTEIKPNNNSNKTYSCAFLLFLTLLLSKSCF